VYAYGMAEAIQRQSMPAKEIVSLSDYRQRHDQ
jgi:alkaline phosphatase D